jgi:DNA polymerase I
MQYFIGNNKNIVNITKCSFSFLLEYFKDINIIQVDTETQGFFDHKNRVLTIQLGDRYNQFVLEFSTLTKEEKNILNTEIFINPNKKKLFQNAKFDIKFLWLEGFDIINVYDTMLAEQILNAGKDTADGFFSLYGLCKRYCNIELDKSIRGEIHRFGICEPVVAYAANDVKYLEDIRDIQLKKLIELRLAKEDDQDELTVLGLENKSVIVFASMEYNGILLDVKAWKKVEILLEEKLLKIEEELNNFIWQTPIFTKYRFVYHDLFTAAKNVTSVNWSSPAQKLELLQLLDSKITDTSERELSRFKHYPIVCKLLEYSKTNKLYTAFAKKMYSHINPMTNRIHTDFFQILSTGRVSSNKPNLQQIPSRSEIGGLMRSCFIPKPGYKMVGGDFSGCELRVIAEFSKDPIWVNAFLDGKDLHSELCAATFDIDVKDVKSPTPFKPDIKYRDVQKTLNFG